MYLSFVSVGRNDNYGGDFDFRLQNSVRFIAHYVEKYKIPSEYIFVNYNPFYDKPSLQESLDWPKDRKYLKIRIIDVPPEVHKEVADPNIRKPVPVLEYIAKNVGIRRAKGEYVLATNPDIIFNPKILKYIAKRRLRKDTFYRTDRCDFTKIPEEIVNGSPRSYVRHIRKKTFNIALKGNRYDVKPGTGLGWQLFKKRIYNFF